MLCYITGIVHPKLQFHPFTTHHFVSVGSGDMSKSINRCRVSIHWMKRIPPNGSQVLQRSRECPQDCDTSASQECGCWLGGYST